MAGYRLISFDELESTNGWALENLERLEDRDVVTAAVQTAGRGRLNRVWVSHVRGSLYLSLVLKPAARPVTPPLGNLSQWLAVCLCAVLDELGVKPTIKWPNDVLVDGRKLAGILAQVRSSGDRPLGLVLGVGVNVNHDAGTLDSVGQPAHSLSLLLGHPVDQAILQARLLDRFFAGYDRFLEAGFALIRDEFLGRCGFLGRPIEVRMPGETVRGVAESVGADGALVLRLSDGRARFITMGDVFGL